jgi:hypothetical protein
MNMELGELIPGLLRGVAAFEAESHRLLGLHESSPSRTIILKQTYEQLSGLSLKQDDLLRQALRCIEGSLFRAAHVMGWAAFADFLEQKLAEDGLAAVKTARPKWKSSSIEELREEIPEAQLIDVAREIGLCRKNEAKALHGLLNKRNECAHPSEFYPGLNESLGYISELLQRIAQLSRKNISP